MIIRKLEQSEHIATRKLWEEIFPEDTKAFLDYYYYIKAAKNQIYVVEEDGRICSGAAKYCFGTDAFGKSAVYIFNACGRSDLQTL